MGTKPAIHAAKLAEEAFDAFEKTRIRFILILSSTTERR
jgi:hypothetical protein